MILKKDKVKLTGPCLINEVGSRGPASSSADARIISADESGATIEVACTCGSRIHIRCDYTNPRPGEADSRSAGKAAGTDTPG